MASRHSAGPHGSVRNITVLRLLGAGASPGAGAMIRRSMVSGPSTAAAHWSTRMTHRALSTALQVGALSFAAAQASASPSGTTTARSAALRNQRRQPRPVSVRSFSLARRPALSASAAISHLHQGLGAGKRAQHTEPHRSADASPPPRPPPLSSSSRSSGALTRWPPVQEEAASSSVSSSTAAQQAAAAEQRQGWQPVETVSKSMPIASASAGTSTVADKAASSSAAAAFATTQLSKSVAKVSSKETDVAEADDEKAKPKGPLLRRVWSVIKHEAQHYWHGTKLLGKEMSISARLVRRVMLGYSLTRRERRQLKRTTADILRLIPFVPFVIIPFAELLLPVAIKVFPNMLPSTFESKFAEEEKRRGLIKVRLEMAKFLQETIKDGGLQASERLQSKDEFKEFFRKVRSTGESPSSEDVLKVARLFDDDLTLDNLSRPQLVSICRYMQVNAFGTDNYLRYQIRNRLSRLRQDDMVIASEGLDNMSHHELQKACQDRGIVTANLTDARLGSELSQWIDLHLHQRISGTLLILSKAFNFVAQGSADAAGATPQLRALELTLSSLPANLLNEAELNVHSDSATNKQRLEVLQEQEELIEDEAEQEQEEKEAREKDRERKRAAAAAEKKARAQREEEEEEAARALLPPGELHTRSIAAGSASGTGTGEGAAAATSPASSVSTAGYTDKLASSNGSSMKPAAASEEEEVDARMTHEQLSELGEALALLSAKSSVLREREELNELMKEVSEVEQLEADASLADAAALASDSVNTKRGDASKEAAAFFPASGDGQGASEAEKAVEAESEKAKQSAARALSQQSSATRSLVKRVTKMLQKIDEQLEAYDRDVGSRMHIIKASPTGKISVDDLESALRLIKHRPDEEVLEKIVDKLDVDNDGLVPLEDVLELAKEESGLGILRDESIQDIREQGQALKNEEPDRAIRKSDIVDG